MGAPLILGAARVVGRATRAGARVTGRRANSKIAQRSRAFDKHPELLRRVRARERRRERGQQPLTDEEKMEQYENVSQLLGGKQIPIVGKINPNIKIPGARTINKLPGKKSIKRIKAASATVVIAETAFYLWIIQITFWVLGMIGFSVEFIPVAKYFLPGETTFILANTIIIAVGVGTLLFAIGVYTIRGVHCFAGWKGLCFIFSFALYAAPFINFFPWIALWCISVVMLQK